MNQLDMFADKIPAWQGGPAQPAHPVARGSDPISSHVAGTEHVASGRAKANRILAVSYVDRAPGKTSKELSAMEWCQLDRHELARRLSDAKELGEVRAEVGTGKGKELIWFPGEDP